MKRLAFLVASAAAIPILHGGPILRIEDLGTLGGSQMSGAAINASGQVAGTGTDAQGYLRAFSSTNGSTGVMPAGNLPASANGIGTSGQVVGATFVNGNTQATLWSDGIAQNIGGLGGPSSSALAINARNQIAGWSMTEDGAGHAVVYSGSGVEDVSLPGSIWSSAYAIDNSGAIAATALTGWGTFSAYTWSPALGYTSLGTLGGANSYASGMNDRGQVVGNSSAASGYSHAFLADNSGLHDLGTLGGQSSYAYGINNAGAVVGYATLGDGNHAFLYLKGIMYDLNLLIPNLEEWDLTAAYAINDAGQITGTGILDGVEHAFRLDTAPGRISMMSGSPLGESVGQVIANPEPGTVGMVLIGVLLCAGGIRRQSKPTASR